MSLLDGELDPPFWDTYTTDEHADGSVTYRFPNRPLFGHWGLAHFVEAYWKSATYDEDGDFQQGVLYQKEMGPLSGGLYVVTYDDE